MCIRDSLVVDEVHLFQFRIPARQGAAQGPVQRMHGAKAPGGGVLHIAVDLSLIHI